jgi:tRNA (cmo5U34)-methyltransferase
MSNNHRAPAPDSAEAAFGGSHARVYAEGPPRQVPGFESLHRMTIMLLAERVPRDGRVLVHGAGGGLELKALGDAQPGWTFDGVDPSPEMLDAAGRATEAHAARIELHEGYVKAAPTGPFDGATCLLTMHFVPCDQRLSTLDAIRKRLRPGAPFVMAHISYPQDDASRDRWSRRNAAFSVSNGMDAAVVETGRQAMLVRLPIVAPDREEALLTEAGFMGTELFYAAFGFRGWVSYAS